MEQANLLTQFSDQLTALVREASPCVVQVGGRHFRPASGTVVGTERVVTVSHWMPRARDLSVRDGGGTVRQAELIGTDDSSGLAVLRVPGLDARPLEAAGDPSVGQIVLALGRTLSGALVASAGIASVLGGPLRTGRRASLELVLRADLRIHPLGTGGPLVDARGKALGIAMGAMMRGMPLFVPATIAWRIAENIAAHGSTRRGYLGISAQPVRLPERQRAGRAQETGLVVIAVAPGSPAEQAGVLVGDIVVGFDGHPVEDHDRLIALLDEHRAGRPAALEILRAGELKTVEVTVGVM